MNAKSIWKDTKIDLKYPKLKENKNVDVLIIGGGITGVSIANSLNDSNMSVCLVEKNKIGFGVTSNTTGKLTYLQDNILYKIKNKELYLKSQIEAIDIAKSLIKKNNIDCDFIKTKSYLFSTNDKDINKIKDIKYILNKNSISVKECKLPLIKTKYSICVDDTYIFNPIKYIYGLLSKISNINIYEYTKIEKIYKDNGYYVCSTKNNYIKTKIVIFACHYPYFTIPYLFPIKGKLEKSYISASRNNIDSVSAISYDKPIISFRTYKDYLIYLNGSHTLSKKINYKNNFLTLISDLKKLKLKPDYLWSNKDIITNDYLPYIGYIKENMLIATGFNTWGMTNGILSGKIISDIILNKKNEYIDLFNPKRSNNINVITDSISSISAYIKSYTVKNHSIEYTKVNSKEIGIYKDSNGIHKVYTICPHLKCKLIFNEVEKTWDCPCHGSRFDIDGKSIEGPSNYDISYKDK